MKIGILEIMPKGHYTLVDSIARIFGSNENNLIYIFTHTHSCDILMPMLAEMNNNNIHLLCMNENEELNSFLKKINGFNLDRIYIVTLEKFFKEIYSANFNSPIYLFIHNIDSWFRAGLNYQLYNFFQNFSLSQKIFYFFKVSFIYPVWRKKVISKVYQTKGAFVVLNKILKEELKNYVNERLIEVIPFSVYNEKLKNNNLNKRLLRICVPGMISMTRRDYISLFQAIESDIGYFKDKIELDLLGGISYGEGGEKIIEYAESLIKKGIKLVYYNKPLVPLFEFDQQLSKADVILGNMNIIQNKFSKYGKTKESGIIFTMIRCAKPGLLPEGYALIDDLKSSSIIFRNYEDLIIKIQELIQNPSSLNRLKEEALKNSLKFEPEKILKELIS